MNGADQASSSYWPILPLVVLCTPFKEAREGLYRLRKESIWDSCQKQEQKSVRNLFSPLQ